MALSTRDWIFGGAVVALTAAAWVVLILGFPLPQGLPEWFWPRHHTPLPQWWLAPLLLAVALFFAWTVARSPTAHRSNLARLVLLGFVLQMGFGLMEGRGIDGIRKRILFTGHAAFAEVAPQQEGVLRLIAEYDTLIARGELPAYPFATKPPGHLLAYVVTERVARPLGKLIYPDLPYAGFVTFASLAWPLLTYLTLLPLLLLSRLLLPEDRVPLPALCFVVLPGITLMPLHLDQCLFPLLSVTSVWLFVWSVTRGPRWAAAAAGVALYVALFFSFSMIALPFLLAGFLLLQVFLVRGAQANVAGDDRDARTRRALQATGLWAAGLVLAFAAGALIFGYNALTWYVEAMASHQAWKTTGWTAGATAYYALLNTVEFAWWLGVPLVALCLRDLIQSVRAAVRRQASAHDALALALVAVLILLALFGRTVGEVARLWLFLTPMVVLLAGRQVGQLFPGKVAGPMAMVGMQLGTVFLFKLLQDFY